MVVNSSTGPALMADVGQLFYNGCTFSCLFETKVSGRVIQDNAMRTTKVMEYTLRADGYVTLPTGQTDIAPNMQTLRDLLTAHAGILKYTGRGFDLIVNTGITGVFDAAWGPVPRLLEFQPLGGGLSAKVIWEVKVTIPEVSAQRLGGLLQLNYETTVSYGEDRFSGLSIKGTLETPKTRISQSNRTLQSTVDDVRSIIDRKILVGIDLALFRDVRVEVNVSRDKRTMEWSVMAEEKPYMDLPMFCTVARGTYSVKPATVGLGLVSWLCNLRATYTVAANYPRRFAWNAFLLLLRLRMAQSQLGVIPSIPGQDQNPAGGGGPSIFRIILAGAVLPVSPGGASNILQYSASQQRSITPVVNLSRRAWLLDFSFDEGLYLDSKTVSFSATWRLITTFSHILIASGLWKKVPEEDRPGGTNLWAYSMRGIQGMSSWLTNRLNPALDVIVDFGGGA